MPLDKAGFIKLIHVAKADLRLSEDVYRDMLRVKYGVTSSTQLNVYQASEFLDHLKGLGFKIRPTRALRSSRAADSCHPCRPRPQSAEERPAEEIRYPVTPTQLADIAQLRENVIWQTPGGYLRWLGKFHHTLAVTDSRTAGKVIAGLRGICMGQHGCELCGPNEGVTATCGIASAVKEAR
jgi:hypothetical protein